MLHSSLKGHLLVIIVIVVGMTLTAAVVIQHFTNHFALAVILSMVLGLVLGVILGSQFADSLIQRVQRLASGVRRIQQGDLSQSVELLSLDEIRGLEEGLAGLLLGFRDVVGEMKQVSFQINRTDQKLSRLVKKVITQSEGIDRLAQGIARGSEKQALIVEQTALGLGRELNEMDSLVRRAGQTVNKIDEARSKASRGEADARRTLAQMEHALAQMDRHTEPLYRLAQKVEKLKVVMDVLDEISRKTDLLSLNASIEATRAGELGRGFALVADEIRSMAVNSKQSAQQIGRTVESLLEDNRRITDSLKQTQNAVGAGQESIHAIVTTFSDLLGAVGAIAGQVNDIEDAMQQQAIQIRTLLERYKELSELVEVNLQATGNTTRAAENQKQDMQEIDRAMRGLQNLSETVLQTQQRFQLQDPPAEPLSPNGDGEESEPSRV